MVQASSLIYTLMPCLNGAEAFIGLAMLMGKYQPQWRSCHMRKHKQDITVYSNYTVNAMKSSYCFRLCIFSCNFTRGMKFRTMVCTSTENVLIILLPRQQRCSANLRDDAHTQNSRGAPKLPKWLRGRAKSAGSSNFKDPYLPQYPTNPNVSNNDYPIKPMKNSSLIETSCGGSSRKKILAPEVSH